MVFLGCWKDWVLLRKKEGHLDEEGWLLYIIKMIKIIYDILPSILMLANWVTGVAIKS